MVCFTIIYNGKLLYAYEYIHTYHEEADDVNSTTSLNDEVFVGDYGDVDHFLESSALFGECKEVIHEAMNAINGFDWNFIYSFSFKDLLGG